MNRRSFRGGNCSPGRSVRAHVPARGCRWKDRGRQANLGLWRPGTSSRRRSCPGNMRFTKKVSCTRRYRKGLCWYCEPGDRRSEVLCSPIIPTPGLFLRPVWCWHRQSGGDERKRSVLLERRAGVEVLDSYKTIRVLWTFFRGYTCILSESSTICSSKWSIKMPKAPCFSRWHAI